MVYREGRAREKCKVMTGREDHNTRQQDDSAKTSRPEVAYKPNRLRSLQLSAPTPVACAARDPNAVLATLPSKPAAPGAGAVPATVGAPSPLPVDLGEGGAMRMGIAAAVAAAADEGAAPTESERLDSLVALEVERRPSCTCAAERIGTGGTGGGGESESRSREVEALARSCTAEGRRETERERDEDGSEVSDVDEGSAPSSSSCCRNASIAFGALGVPTGEAATESDSAELSPPVEAGATTTGTRTGSAESASPALVTTR